MSIAWVEIRQYGYLPYDVVDPSSVGIQNREGSRTLEVRFMATHILQSEAQLTYLCLPQYAFNDFGVSQVARLLGLANDTQKYANRSLSYRNIWDPNVTSDGFKGPFQRFCFLIAHSSKSN